MASVFCISDLLSRWWNTKLHIEHSFLLEPSTVALNIPLVVDKILRYIPVPELKRLRLVNRTWNHEAVGHLQKRGARVTLSLPYQYNHRTQELLVLFDDATRLEAETDIKWRWPFTRINLEIVPFQRQTFADLEHFLCKISLHITDIRAAEGLKLKDSTQESSGLLFPHLIHITWGCGDVSMLNWVIERSPKFSNLVLVNKPGYSVKYMKLGLQKEGEQEQGSYWISTTEDLNTLVFLLTKLKRRLRALSINGRLNDPKSFADFAPLTTNFVNLTNIKIHSVLAATLFGSPDRLPRVKSLELLLDDRNPEVWLRQWNGEPVLSVEELLLYSVRQEARCLPPCVVHKIAQIFPNTKVLKIRLVLSDDSKLVVLDRWVPALEHLEEFHVEMSGSISKLRAARPDSWSTFAGLKVLKLVYSNGLITDAYCQSVFLQMGKLERLHIISKNDNGEGVSAATLAQMRKRQ